MADFKVSIVLGAIDKASGVINSILGKTGKVAGASNRAVGGLVGGIGGLGKVVAAVATGAAVKKLADQFLSFGQRADEIAKFSKQVGLTAESLQEWRHAAELAGVGGDAFDKSASQLNRRLGEMRGGIGETATFMQKVAPKVFEQLKGAKDTDEAMQIAVRAMAAIEDPAKRAAFGSKLFGEELGGKMARFAVMGADGIRAAREEARKFGLISGESAGQAENWQDALTRFKASTQGLTIAIGSKLLPKLTPLVDKITGWMTANKGLIDQKIDRIVDGIFTAVSNLGAWLTANGPTLWEGFSKGAKAVGAVFDFIVNNIGLVQAAVGTLAAFWVAGKLMGAVQGIAGAFSFVAAHPAFAAIMAAIAGAKLLADYYDRKTEAYVNDEVTQRTGARTFRSQAEMDAWMAQEQARQAASPAPAPSAMSAVGTTQAATQAVRDGQSNVNMVVDFQNVPAGVQVSSPQVSGTAPTRVQSNVGRRMVGTAGSGA